MNLELQPRHNEKKKLTILSNNFSRRLKETRRGRSSSTTRSSVRSKSTSSRVQTSRQGSTGKDRLNSSEHDNEVTVKRAESMRNIKISSSGQQPNRRSQPSKGKRSNSKSPQTQSQKRSVGIEGKRSTSWKQLSARSSSRSRSRRALVQQKDS